MHIEELKEGDCESVIGEGAIVVWDPKRVLVGAGARALFYPTLLYNVVRNKIQSEFRWWDRVDEFVLLGAVPFPTDVPLLKASGVGGVITLNESYETLVPSSLYHEFGIEHLVIPTRDYLFAPSFGNICQAVEFIHGNELSRKTTYVHCKAGRGRSTTIVLCYLVKYKQMTPEAAYEYVRATRPRVLLASAQWKAVQDFYYELKKPMDDIYINNSSDMTLGFLVEEIDSEYFDDSSLVVITESDLDGYEENHDIGLAGQNMIITESDLDGYEENHDIGLADQNMIITESDLDGYEENHDIGLACQNMLIAESDLDGYEENHDIGLAGQNMLAKNAAIAKLSCLWHRSYVGQKVSSKKLQKSAGNTRIRVH